MTPAEFLLAKVADLEQVAREATPGPWRYNPAKEWHTPEELAKHPVMRLRGEEFVGAGPADATVGVAACGPADEPQSMADAHFIATWDPAFVLAWCAAVRQVTLMHCPMSITKEHPQFNDAHLTTEPMTICRSCEPETMWRRAKSYPCRTVLALLQPFTDDPNFDPAWRTETRR